MVHTLGVTGKILIVITSTVVVDKLRRLRVDNTHCRCTIKLKKAVKIGNRRVHQHYQHYCVVPLRKEANISNCGTMIDTQHRGAQPQNSQVGYKVGSSPMEGHGCRVAPCIKVRFLD